MSDTAPTRYRFGPLERRGLVAGWRGGQIAAVAMSLVAGVAVLRATASPVGVVLAVAALGVGVGVATWPLSGRTAEEWAPDVIRHALSLGRGARRRSTPFLGVRLIRVDAGPGSVGPHRDGGPGIGVLHDRSRRTFTAVLGASEPGFVLLAEDDKARRVSAWSGVLASLARQGTAVHRVQWVQRVVPGDVAVERAPLDTVRPGVGYEAARASYDVLVETEANVSHRHEVLLAVSIHAGRAARAVKGAGGGETGACALLLRETAALRRRLTDAAVDVGAVLSPAALTSVMRGAFDTDSPCGDGPGPRAPSAAVAPDGPGDGARPWPMGVATEWGRLRVDGTWHATYWVAEWPRTDAGADFLGPLLLTSDIRRTVSVVMEPVGPVAASRKVEQARTADIANAELRRRGGFLSTARRQREEEILERRELELADGHAHYRFSGYVTVSAPDPDALEVACGRAEQAAAQAGLELRRCYGDQANTFMCTLPLGRGLA